MVISILYFSIESDFTEKIKAVLGLNFSSFDSFVNSILLDINSFLVSGKLKAEGIYDSFFDAKLTIPYATSCPSKLLI